ncbi:hypothetical protein [Sphaerisporangium rhizosphaerae]|uniref:Uncharacterized protein n=1 Tax=Sphaerisporangium rhizosphaerae TaxID=2269375 RepID=A0ABW2P0V7_9ACTN
MAQIHVPCWSRGRVTLVGDAGYLNAGQCSGVHTGGRPTRECPLGCGRALTFLMLLLDPPGAGHQDGERPTVAFDDGVLTEVVGGVGAVADVFTDRSDSPTSSHGSGDND